MIVVWVRWFSLETRAFLLYYNYYYYCQPCRLSCPTWWCVKSILEGNALKDGICDNIFMNGNHWSARRRRRSFRPVGGYVGMNGRGRERKGGGQRRDIVGMFMVRACDFYWTLGVSTANLMCFCFIRPSLLLTPSTSSPCTSTYYIVQSVRKHTVSITSAWYAYKFINKGETDENKNEKLLATWVVITYTFCLSLVCHIMYPK